MASMTDSAAHLDRTDSLILLDLYGALLTEPTRELMDLYLSEDLSLAEIAENLGISRQGVHDAIARGLASLKDFESRLGLMSRQRQVRQLLDQAVTAIRSDDAPSALEPLNHLSELL